MVILRNRNRSLLVFVLSLSFGKGLGQNNQATCKVDSDGNCLDRTCDDKYPDCEKWALEGHCKGNNVKFMLNFCKKACNICDFDGNLKDLILMKGDVELLETPYGKTQTHPEGEHSARVAEVLQDMIRYVESFLNDERYASIHHACKNIDRNCAYWKAIGECEANPVFMLGSCSPVCENCHMLDYETRCPLDPTIPMALKEPGDLSKIFERITTDPQFTKYNVTTLSKPSGTDGIHDGPWIITLDNFLTEEESDRLIALGAEEGYLNSIDFISNRSSGARTSKHTWCKGNCTKDPMMKAVDAKIEALLGIPHENSEYFQLLKYEVGEFYREHSDYNPVHLTKQTGVRLMTVFLYLNTVEGGGETNFPSYHNLTVAPIKGRALIWPSVLDEDPNKEDNRTLHQALPVEKGIKYAANVWIHQREYRESYKFGCAN